MTVQRDTEWPELQYGRWHETLATLQLWMQIVGKVRLALTPWLNHSWHVPLYVTARGLGTSPIPLNSQILELEFDFITHHLDLRTSEGRERRIRLEPQSVADFYQRVRLELEALGATVTINEMPCEVADPIAFSKDYIHAAYDRTCVQAFWRVLIQADRLFKLFRSGYLGKASPVHFFWGSFDLAVTRFSGRAAPPHPAGVPGLSDAVVREAYSHELSSAGFWPGNEGFPEAAFYAYAYPEPAGFRQHAVACGAYFEPKLGEFVLPYAVVRTAADPDSRVLEFLHSTYVAAAQSGGWDRAPLECALGVPGRVRAISQRAR